MILSDEQMFGSDVYGSVYNTPMVYPIPKTIVQQTLVEPETVVNTKLESVQTMVPAVTETVQDTQGNESFVKKYSQWLVLGGLVVVAIIFRLMNKKRR